MTTKTLNFFTNCISIHRSSSPFGKYSYIGVELVYTHLSLIGNGCMLSEIDGLRDVVGEDDGVILGKTLGSLLGVFDG